jgi:Ca2+-binding RTX toxin-like protein
MSNEALPIQQHPDGSFTFQDAAWILNNLEIAISSDGNDFLIGTPGNNTLYGSGGHGTLYGNGGHDIADNDIHDEVHDIDSLTA